jgi:hypothetical protein
MKHSSTEKGAASERFESGAPFESRNKHCPNVAKKCRKKDNSGG